MTSWGIASADPKGPRDASGAPPRPALEAVANHAPSTANLGGTPSPDRTEWLAWRGAGIGASDVAGIMSLSPWQSPWSVWATKVGLSPGQDETRAMRFGKMMEPVLREMFEQETDLWVLGEQTWCQHPDEPWMRCTVDGFAHDAHEAVSVSSEALGLAEFKVTSETPWDEVPAHYQCQAQWAMAVTGLPVCWFGVLHMAFGRPDFRVYEFARDDTDIALLIDRCRAFWFDSCVGGVAPPADGHKATADALATAWEADNGETVEATVKLIDRIDKLRDLKAEAKAIEADIAVIENELRAALGEATALTWGEQTLATWKAQDRTSLDTKALRAAEPELAARFTTTTTSRVLRLKTNKEN